MNTERNPTEVRQGAKTGVVRNVLIISITLAVVLLAIIYFYFYRP